MNTKIIIEVRGGTVQCISANRNCDIIIVDYDNIDNGESPVSGVLAQDATFQDGEAYQLFTEPGKQEEEVRDELKRIHF